MNAQRVAVRSSVWLDGSRCIRVSAGRKNRSDGGDFDCLILWKYPIADVDAEKTEAVIRGWGTRCRPLARMPLQTLRKALEHLCKPPLPFGKCVECLLKLSRERVLIA